MNLRRSFVLLLLIEACAAPTLSMPTSLEVVGQLADFDDIPPERCTPKLHGMFLTYPGGNALLNAELISNAACEKRVLFERGGRKLAEAELAEIRKEGDIVRAVGIGVAIIAVAEIVAGVILGAQAAAKQAPAK